MENVSRRIVNIAKKKNLTIEQIIEHYETEKALATRLRNSTREDRIQQSLYTSIYDELFRKIPYHSMLRSEGPLETRTSHVATTIRFLARFLKPDSVFLEIGAGDCLVSIEVAKKVKRVYALDVSNELTENVVLPKNADLIVSDGVSIPVPENSVDVAFSDQLMEHLHPDDAVEQLGNIYDALAPGGTYICVTPNRLIGPRDISAGFDKVATGFHLKEYLPTELADIFVLAGFSKRYLLQGFKQQISWNAPLVPATVFLFAVVESLLKILPFPIRSLGAKAIFRGGGMTVIGVK